MVGVVVVVVELESGLIMHTYINPSLLAIINAANQSYLFTRSIRRSSSVSWSPFNCCFNDELDLAEDSLDCCACDWDEHHETTTLDK